jgi:hypothetical protein
VAWILDLIVLPGSFGVLQLAGAWIRSLSRRLEGVPVPPCFPVLGAALRFCRLAIAAVGPSLTSRAFVISSFRGLLLMLDLCMNS